MSTISDPGSGDSVVFHRPVVVETFCGHVFAVVVDRYVCLVLFR